MLGGIAFQLFAIVIYVICELEFFWRYVKDRPFVRKEAKGETRRGVLTGKIQVMICVLFFSTVCLFIRYADLPSRTLCRIC